MPLRAQVWSPFGATKFVEPKNGTDFTLEELRQHCQCSIIQIIEVGDRFMVLDDNGILNSENPTNFRASVMGLKHQILMEPERGIVGTVMVCPKEYIK